MSDLVWMQRAYDLALRAALEGEVPVGAVLVDSSGQVLGEGYNQVIAAFDPSAHAEMQAIRAAAQGVNNYRLEHTTLYVTLEPCCMCAGVLIHARIGRLVYATRDLRAGAAGSVFNLLQHPALNHAVQLDEGILQQECQALLSNFFKQRRQ